MPLKPEYREETYKKKPNTFIAIFVIIALSVVFIAFRYYHKTDNVFKFKINDFSVQNGIFEEIITIDYTAKDIMNFDTNIFYVVSEPLYLGGEYIHTAGDTDKSFAYDEVNVKITKGNRYGDKKELIIKVDSSINKISFSSIYSDFKISLIRNKETNEWEIKK